MSSTPDPRIADDPVWTLLGAFCGFMVAAAASATMIALEVFGDWSWLVFVILPASAVGAGYLMSRQPTLRRFARGVMGGAGLALVAELVFAMWVVNSIGG
jgi:uncharacterized membrane protein